MADEPMNFGVALAAVQGGSRVRRTAWPDGEYLRLTPPDIQPPSLVYCQPAKTYERVLSACAAADVLAADWSVIEADA